MQKIIDGKIIRFCDSENNVIMYFDYSTDECIWCFNTDNTINITPDMELYNILDEFMKQDYLFWNDGLGDYKDKQKLIWYSDCYYNPDDEYSVASVSCLNIKRENNSLKIWCTRKLDEIFSRSHKFYCIGFSPLGNGKYSKNIDTGLTLQDDFVQNVYQKLLNKNKVLKK